MCTNNWLDKTLFPLNLSNKKEPADNTVKIKKEIQKEIF